ATLACSPGAMPITALPLTTAPSRATSWRGVCVITCAAEAAFRFIVSRSPCERETINRFRELISSEWPCLPPTLVRHAQLLEEERIHVRRPVDGAAEAVADAVAGAEVHPQQDGILRSSGILEPRRHLVGVGGINPAVVHTGQQQHRWAGRAVLDVVQG